MEATVSISTVLHSSGRNVRQLVAQGKTVKVVRHKQVLFYAVARPPGGPVLEEGKDLSAADLKAINRAFGRLAEWPDENPVIANRQRESR